MVPKMVAIMAHFKANDNVPRIISVNSGVVNSFT